MFEFDMHEAEFLSAPACDLDEDPVERSPEPGPCVALSLLSVAESEAARRD